MSKTEKPNPPDDVEQSARFLAMAKALKADENYDSFEKAIQVITPPKEDSKVRVHKDSEE